MTPSLPAEDQALDVAFQPVFDGLPSEQLEAELQAPEFGLDSLTALADLGLESQEFVQGSDATLASLTPSSPGLSLDPSQVALPWSAQVAAASNDASMTSSALLSADEAFAVSRDQLSGLFLVDDSNQITLVEHNPPPLLADVYASDSLLVFKGEGPIPLGAREQIIDPLLIDLAGDGLSLVSLDQSNVQFDLLNNAAPVTTGWLSLGADVSQRDDAFLVLDRDGDGQISSISELVSELFGSTGSVRRYATGVEALSSLDINGDGRFDHSDPAWSDLALWFDDGDGITQAGELEGLGGWLSSIDLAAESLDPAESAALANPLLRQGVVSLTSGGSASYYDVGLRYGAALEALSLLAGPSLGSLTSTTAGDFTNLLRAGQFLSPSFQVLNTGNSISGASLSFVGYELENANYSFNSDPPSGWSFETGKAVEIGFQARVMGSVGDVVRQSGALRIEWGDGYSVDLAAENSKNLITFAGDLNFDGIVGMRDLVVLNEGARLQALNGQVVLDVDANYDGSISLLDLVVLAEDWGQSLHQAAQPSGVSRYLGDTEIEWDELTSQGALAWSSRAFIEAAELGLQLSLDGVAPIQRPLGEDQTGRPIQLPPGSEPAVSEPNPDGAQPNPTVIAFEDQPFLLSLGQLFPNAHLIQEISISSGTDGASTSWLQALVAEAGSQISDQLVIEANLLDTDQAAISLAQLGSLAPGTEITIDLLVSDNRMVGEGLLGLQGDLHWNPAAATLLAVDLSDSLPLFRETSETKAGQWQSGSATIAAAGLPPAAVGSALGDQLQERFARLVFELTDPTAALDFSFDPTLYPAIGSSKLSANQIFTINLDRPLITQLQGVADQEMVGVNNLLLEARYANGGRWQEHIDLTILNSNDAPLALGIPADWVVEEDSPFTANLSSLFSDVDTPLGDALSYSLIQAPAWLNLDGTTGELHGTPDNNAVGTFVLTLEAQDLAGATARQSQRISVLNVNDAPELGGPELLPQANARQGDSFTYTLPVSSFIDPDQGDALLYRLGDSAPTWLQIDASSGQITGQPSADAPGSHSIEIIATDRSGATASRTLAVLVENVNDAPTLNAAALEAFRQSLGERWILQEDQTVSLDPFSAGAWFGDPDGDTLTYSAELVLLGDSDETLIASPSWLQVDPATGVIQANPGNAEVGDYRLVLKGSDQAGLQASASLQLQVQNSNDAPLLDVEQAEAFANRSLAEDTAFTLTIPPALFQDPDRGDQLSFSVSQADGSPLPDWLRFDPVFAQLTGISRSPDAALALTITATDLSGASTSHQLQLHLPRQATTPGILNQALTSREGEPLLLANALQLASADPDSEVVLVRVALEGVPEGFTLQQLDPEAEPLPDPKDGVIELASLDGVALVDASGDFAGDLQLAVQVISREINGDEVAVVTNLQLAMAAVADVPNFNSTGLDVALLDPFLPLPASAYATASSVDSDGSETLDHYELTYTNSGGRISAADLLVVDASGNSLGSWEVLDVEGRDQTIWRLNLTPQEWDQAILRSAERLVGEQVGFTAVAVSREANNGDTARSAALPLNLLLTPLVEAAELELLQAAPRVRINDGSSSATARFELNLESAHAKDNLALQVEVPPGTTLTAATSGSEVTQLGEQVYLISADSFGSLAFDLLPPLDFSGTLDFNLTPLATARSFEADPFGALTADLDQGFAAFGEPIAMELPVVPLAREPELTAVAFDPSTGALSLTLQRGRNSRGEANGAEQLALSIAGVPSGYSLVLPGNEAGAEQRAGASDAIGSLVLFNVASIPDGDFTDPAAPITFNLLLRSTASAAEQVSRLELAELSVAASAQLLPTTFLPIGHRSSSVSESLAISNWQGQPAQLQVDPLLIDLAGDGLNLVALEHSSVQFDLLNNGTTLSTGWLAPSSGNSQRDDAFLVMDRDGDGQISSISELVSEFFGSSGSVRRYATGVEALSSLDANADGVINRLDAAWSELSLWFDDGDGITQSDELQELSGWLASIDLAAVPLDPAASQAPANALLRQGQLSLSSGAPASYYDVGLRFDPSGLNKESLLELSAGLASELKEAGDPVKLEVLVPAFASITSEDAARTLVRLSGVPAGSEPNLGVQDSRGDWVFTWAELQQLQAMGSDLAIQSLDQRSGPATVQLLVSQITADGGLKASAFTSVRLDVTPVATSPTLLLRKLRSQEDEPLQLSSLFVGGEATLNDRDGSERLTYDLSGLRSGIRLLRDGQELALELEPEGSTYRLADPLTHLEGVTLIPTENLSGNISFQVTAMATEQANADVFSITKTASLFLAAIVDPPILTIDETLLTSGFTLQQGSAISLTGVTGELIDTDGSEELLVELSGLPDWVTLRHDGDPSWRPRAQIKLANGTSVVRVEATDLSAGWLQLVDVISSGSKDDFSLSVSALAREKSNGLISVDQNTLQSEAQQLRVLYSSNAHQPLVSLGGDLRLIEDSLSPISLAEVLQVSLSNRARREQLLIRLTDLPSGVHLQDAAGHQLQPGASGAYELLSIEGVELVHTTPEASGNLSFWFEAIAESLTGARSASSGPQLIALLVEAVADTPLLTAPAQLTINSNDRVSLASISLSSPDQDGSERLSLEISGLPGRSEPLEIAAADLKRLQLELPNQLEDLTLTLRARSLEAAGGDQAEAWSEPQQLLLLASAAAARPALEVSGTLIGLEDMPMPLLAEEGGVITADLGVGANQALSFRLYELPTGAVLLKNNNGSWAEISLVDGAAHLVSLEGVAIRLGADAHGSASFKLDAIATAARSGDTKRTTAELQLAITPLNDAPRSVPGSDLSLQEAQSVTLNLNERFTDPDGEPLSFRVATTPLPSWISLDPDTADLTFTPGNEAVTPEAEPYVLEIIATDALGLSAKQTIRLSVGNLNQTPAANTSAPGRYTTSQDDLLQIDLAALFIDPDRIHGDELSYEVDLLDGSPLPLWLSNDVDGRLQGTPTNADVGSVSVAITARDQGGLTAVRTITIGVENVNDAPQLSDGFITGETLRIQEDSPFSLNLFGLFEDPDSIFGDGLTVALTSKGGWPGWLQWDPDAEVLSAIHESGPANEDVGIYTLTWSAQDASFERATYRLNLVVENTNDAPDVINEIVELQKGKENSTYSIDLSRIFGDVDRGDSLRYEIVVLDGAGNAIAEPAWLSLREIESTGLKREDVIAIEPVIRDPQTGEILDPKQVAALQPGQIVNLEVLVEDLRKNIERVGVTGIDLQISWSSASLELNSTDEATLKAGISSELPFGRLVNTARQQDGVISISASSAPYLGVGSEIGEDGPAVFATIPFRIVDPRKTVVFELAVRTDQEGINEIITLDNAANEQRLELASFTTAQSLELVAKPGDKDVGVYTINLTATDDFGASTTTSFDLQVENVNDEARIGILLPSTIEQRDDRETELLNLSGAFLDDDLPFGDVFRYELIRSASARTDEVSLSVITVDGAPIIKASIRGLLEPLSETVMVRATEIRHLDQSEGRVLEQSFSLVVNPTADLIEIQRDDSAAQAEVAKNTTFSLSETLSLLSITDSRDVNDETYLYIESLPGLLFNLVDELDGVKLEVSKEQQDQWRDSWHVAQALDNSVVYRAKISELQNVINLSVSQILATIEVTPPRNQGYRMESGEIGLPIQIWSESYVRGDEDDNAGTYGVLYGVVASEKLKTSVSLSNNAPFVIPGAARNISYTLPRGSSLRPAEQDKSLVVLSDLFADEDIVRDDNLFYRYNLPPGLAKLVEINEVNSSIDWRDDAVLTLSEVGSYRLQIWAYDSNFTLGDQSAVASADVFLNLRSREGADLFDLFRSLRDVDPNIFVPELVAIIGGSVTTEIASSPTFLASKMLSEFPTVSHAVNKLLNVGDAQKDGASASIVSVIDKLTRGQLANLDPADVNSGLVLVAAELSSQEVSNLVVEGLTETVVQDLAVLPSGFELVSYGPMLAFEIESNEETDLSKNKIGYAIVNIELPSGLDSFDSILKTRFIDLDGDGISETERAYRLYVDDRLRSVDDPGLSSFVIADYSLEDLASEYFTFDIASNSALALGSSLRGHLGLDEEDNLTRDLFASFDGSAYLLDLDGDENPDVIRMLLLDNGFFDGNNLSGIIYDPLIPVKLSAASTGPSGGQVGLPSASATSQTSPERTVDRELPGATGPDIIPSDPPSSSADSATPTQQPASESVQRQPLRYFGSPDLPTVVKNSRTLVGLPFDPSFQPLEQRSGFSRKASFSSGLGAAHLPNPWFGSRTPAQLAFEADRDQPLLARQDSRGLGLQRGFRALTQDLADTYDAFLDQIRDGINSAGIGGLLLGALIAPGSIRSASNLLIKQDPQNLKLRKAASTQVRPICVRLIDPRGDCHLQELRYQDGLLIVNAIESKDDDANNKDAIIVCEGNLERLIAATDRPGHALRALEDALLQLSRTPIDHSSAYQWESWLQVMADYHRPTSPRLVMQSRIAKRKLEKQLRQTEKISPTLASLYMSAEILQCYRCLGGDWPT